MSLMKMALLSTCVALALTGCGGGSDSVKEKLHNIGDHVTTVVHRFETTYDSASMANRESGFIDNLVEHGARPSGSESANLAAKWIFEKLDGYGFSPIYQPVGNGKQNIVAEIGNQDGGSRILIIGAHYDSASHQDGTQHDDGVTDNAAAVATLVAIAHQFKEEKSHPDLTVRLVFFADGESSHEGANTYLASLSQEEKGNIAGMVNLDGFVGGDNLYVENADNNVYQCNSNDDPVVTTALQKIITNHDDNPLQNKYSYISVLNNSNDAKAFACAGIPIANLESSNTAIIGRTGEKDGISQTENPKLWDKYNAATNTADNRDTETGWGEIRHTYNDNKKRLEAVGQWSTIQAQLASQSIVLYRFLKHPGL